MIRTQFAICRLTKSPFTDIVRVPAFRADTVAIHVVYEA